MRRRMNKLGNQSGLFSNYILIKAFFRNRNIHTRSYRKTTTITTQQKWRQICVTAQSDRSSNPPTCQLMAKTKPHRDQQIERDMIFSHAAK